VELKYIKFKIEDGVGRIQFNRPEKLNAVNPDVLTELETTVESCEGNDDIRVVVLTGSEKAFVAGADIEGMAKGDIKNAYKLTDLTLRVQERLADLPKPTIASISGYALGGAVSWPFAVISGSLRIMPCWACRRLPWASFPAAAVPSACLDL
jgi:enoyl-CoA hydratase/carnithine racemase